MTTTGPMLILPPIPDPPRPLSTRTINDPAARLRWAIVNDNLSLVTRIVRRYPDLLQQRDPANGWTSLHYAGYYGHYLICVFLINQGHDKDEISLDFNRNTPLHLAAQKNQEQTVHYLAQHIRRCLDWRNDQMESALMVAAKMGHQPCITLLLDFGANVDLPGPSGNRAIHIAAAYGHIKAIRTLVDRGADTATTNLLGFTPLHYSLSYQVHDYLQALIADKKKQKTSAVPPASPGFTFKWNKSTSPPTSTSSSNVTTANNSTNNSSVNLSAGPISGSASMATNKPSPLHHSSTILNVPVVAKPQHPYKQQPQQPMPLLAAAPSLASASQTSLPTFTPANRMNPNSPRSDSPSSGSSSNENGKNTGATTMLKSPLPLTKSPSYNAVKSPTASIEVSRKDPVKPSNFSMPLPPSQQSQPQQPQQQKQQPQSQQQPHQQQQPQQQQQQQQQQPTQHQQQSHHQHHPGQKPHITPTAGAKPPPPPIKQHLHTTPSQQQPVKPSPTHVGSKPALNVNTNINNRKGSFSNGNPSNSTSNSKPYPYSQPYPPLPPQYSSMAKAAAASSSSLVDSSSKNLGVSSPSSGTTSNSASSNSLRGQPPPPPPPPPAMHPEHIYNLSLYNHGSSHNAPNSSSSSVSTGGSIGGPPGHRKASLSKKQPTPVPPVKPPHLHSVPSSGSSLGSSGRTRVLDVNVSTGRRPSRN